MIGTEFQSNQFMIDMTNILAYSEGYLKGIHMGKTEMLKGIGQNTREMLEEFVDSMARVDPSRLHHVYEWYMAGSSEGRLFDINYVVSDGGLTFNSTFRQSKTFSNGSKTVFYDKAEIMERGVPVTITPKNSRVLAFDDQNGEPTFVSGSVVVNSPGGKNVQGSFSDVMDEFFNNYLTQSLLMDSGFTQYLGTPIDYKANLGRAKSGGASAGVQVGYNWIRKAGAVA